MDEQIDGLLDRSISRSLDLLDRSISTLLDLLDRWIARSMDQQIDESLNRWISRQMDRQIDGSLDGRSVERDIGGSLHQWIARTMNRLINGSLDRWIANTRDQQIDGSLDQWISRSLDSLQPRTKPVETNRENAYYFLSSRQKLKPPPSECPISPLPLSKVVQDSMVIIHVGFQTKTTLNRGWGGG